ncbi:transcription elongation factor SPT6-like [Petromyzon marinus]|uniref:transcription elongation factor SPT6-like n=1 Tax=Petromyzon marinus TaxID=7757 RepID=UPI003F6E944F
MSEFVESEAEEEEEEADSEGDFSGGLSAGEEVEEVEEEEEGERLPPSSSAQRGKRGRGRKFSPPSDDDDDEEEEENEEDQDEMGNLKGLINDDDEEEDDDEDDDEGRGGGGGGGKPRAETQRAGATADEDDEEEGEEGEGGEGGGGGGGEGSDEEDDDDDDDTVKRKKHKRKRYEDDDRLEEDDFDLIEENLGVKVKRHQKYRRLNIVDEEEDEEEEEGDDVGGVGAPGGATSSARDEKELIAGHLFQDGGGHDEVGGVGGDDPHHHHHLVAADAFAEELDRQGYGNKGITLYDIRTELHCRYRDLRSPYRSPSPGEAFHLLTKETPETFHVGKLVTAVVTGIAHRRPQGESNDQAIRIDATGLWQCPFCQQDDFPELSEVWNHFDSGACPGQAIGVKLRLDNGVSGFIPTRYLSDRPVRHPEERVKVGMMVHCRVMRVDVEKLTSDLTTRSSDLADSVGEWRPRRDDYYDTEHEERVTQAEERARQHTQRAMYVKRVIVHPSFHNINYKEAEALMATLDQGEAVIRPSSKGTDHLTVTWKVAEGVSQHLDVREERKENPFSLGHSLWINGEEFEDLDEIIARHVQPMASLARDLLSHKYYRESTGGDTRRCVEELLAKAKRDRPSQIPYLISASTEFPGKFLLGYQPRNKPW